MEKRSGKGGRGGYERIVSALPPHAVTRLAAELTVRLFEGGGGGRPPSCTEMGACARAVAALTPMERTRHAETVGRVRSIATAACLAPSVAEIYIALLQAKAGEVVALAEARASVVAHRGLAVVRGRALRVDDHPTVAQEHEQAVAALDEQLAQLDTRLAGSTADLDALTNCDLFSRLLAEAREVGAALGTDVTPPGLVGSAEALRRAQDAYQRARTEALVHLDEAGPEEAAVPPSAQPVALGSPATPSPTID